MEKILSASELRQHQEDISYGNVKDVVENILSEVIKFAEKNLESRSYEYYTDDYWEITKDVKTEIEKLGYEIERDWDYEPDSSMSIQYKYIISW